MKNLITRAFTGLIFVLVIVGAIGYSAYLFLVLFSVITGMTVWELYGLLNGKETNLIKKCTQVLGGVYLFISTFFYRYGLANEDIFLPYILFILALFITELYYKAENPIANWTTLLLIQVYAAASFSTLNLIAIKDQT